MGAHFQFASAGRNFRLEGFSERQSEYALEANQIRPLAENQRAIWLLEQANPGDTIYNIGFAFRIRSPLNINALHEAVHYLVDRHAALRTDYPSLNLEPVRWVHPETRLDFEMVDASSWTSSDLQQSLANLQNQPFDLSGDGEFRVRLYVLEQDSYVLQFVMHHISVDGWSVWIIIDEIGRFYEQLVSGQAKPSLPSIASEYDDFVDWQKEMLAGEQGQEMRDFWAHELSGELPRLQLPAKSNHDPGEKFQRAKVRYSLDHELTEALRNLSRMEGCSLYTIILSAFQILLHYYSGQEDILIGTPVHGRPQARFAKTVGNFANIVAIREQLDESSTFRSLLHKTDATLQDALLRQHYPIALIPDLLGPGIGKSGQQIIQIGFNFLRAPRRFRDLMALAVDNTRSSQIDAYGVQISDISLELDYGIGQADLFLDLVDIQDIVAGELNYNAAIFDENTITAMVNHFYQILRNIVEQPEALISEQNPLTLEEQERLLQQRSEIVFRNEERGPHAVPGKAAGVAPESGAELRTELEQLVSEIWSAVLGVSPPDFHTSFFDLGGHSLKAIQVIMRIQARTGVSIDLNQFLANPTIRGLAEAVTAGAAQAPTLEIRQLTPRERGQLVPLSYAQERMWLMNKMLENDAAFHICNAFHFEGPMDVAAAQRAFNDIIARHEIIRTIFPIVDGIPYQQVLPPENYEVRVIDLRGHGNEQERLEKSLQIIRTDCLREFELETTPPMRHFYIRLDTESYLAYIVFHHIVFDQWSSAVFWQEYRELYEHYSSGKELLLPEVTLQYADFSAWQREWLTADFIRRETVYWQEKLHGLAPLELPTDRPRPPVQTNSGSYRQLPITRDLLQELEQLAQQENVTLFTLLLAIFNLLLMRYSNRTDIAIGVPVANRQHPALENMLGTFVNLLVMRCDLGGSPTFSELLRRVNEVTQDAYSHQNIPFEKLVEEILHTRDKAYTPLVQVMFNMVDAPGSLRFIPGVKSTPVQFDRGVTQFDISFSANVHLDEIIEPQIAIDYNTDLFDGETIEHMLEYYMMLVEQIVADPHRSLEQYRLLTPAEELELLYRWNDTKTPFPEDVFVEQLIAEQAAITPRAAAAVFENQRLSYEELNGRANQFAHYLQRLGTVPGELIAISMDPSLDMLVSLLAIWKAGCAYVPLDPSYPEKRLDYILEDTGASVLISQSTLAEKWADRQCRLVYLDDERDRIAQESNANLPLKSFTPDNLAYVIHTSGSTGEPKGVRISHRNVTNFLLAMQQQPGLGRDDILLAVTTLSFDISVLELFLPLISGARVVLAGRDVAADGRLLASLLEESQATVMQATPATWIMLLDSGWGGRPTLKVLCGGEAMPLDLPERLLPRAAELWNMYGPTETTVWSSVYRVKSVADQISIGRPIANTTMYVLDETMQPVPAGILGELYIGGLGVSSGYLNKPELTAIRFVGDPFSDKANAILFKTGDSARYLHDGNIVVLGRLDQQVKYHGFRIELAEIEHALNSHTSVARSVAAVLDDEDGSKRIVVYYIPADGEKHPDNILRDHLSSMLPAYMVPSRFVALEEFPLTPNLKIDRSALPRPDRIRPNLQTFIVPPSNETEIKLAEIWCDLLQIDNVGIKDNFFELGGYSLLAVRLFGRIEEEFGVGLPLISLFEDATIEHLANLIDTESARQEWSSLVPLTARRNSQKAFYGVHGLTGDVYWFESLAQYLGPDQPFYGLQSLGMDGVQEPLDTIEKLAERYISDIRRQQPDGPYYIGGYSLGANIAYEMAVQLEQQGQDVALLALIDHMPANSDYFKFQWNWVFVKNLLQNLPYRLQDILQLSRNEFLARVRRKIRGLNRGIRYYLPGDMKEELLQTEVHDLIDNADIFPERMQRVIVSNYKAWQLYYPGRYSGHVTLLRARGGRLFCSHDPQMGWGKLADGGVTVYEIPGSHLRIFKEPYVQILAETLSQTIESAQKEFEE